MIYIELLTTNTESYNKFLHSINNNLKLKCNIHINDLKEFLEIMIDNNDYYVTKHSLNLDRLFKHYFDELKEFAVVEIMTKNRTNKSRYKVNIPNKIDMSTATTLLSSCIEFDIYDNGSRIILIYDDYELFEENLILLKLMNILDMTPYLEIGIDDLKKYINELVTKL